MRIIIADDHQFILESIEIMLSNSADYQVVKLCNNGLEVLEFLETNSDIDLILSDYNMPKLNGIELIYHVRQKYPAIKFILLTVSEEVQLIREAFQAGVSGYIMKKAGRKEFEEAIKTVALGKKYYSESVVFELLNKNLQVSDIVEATIKEELTNLSMREIEIVKLIVKEYSTNEIAEKLFISPATVETHRHNILKKLKIKNSIGLVKFAIKNGLV